MQCDPARGRSACPGREATESMEWASLRGDEGRICGNNLSLHELSQPQCRNCLIVHARPCPRSPGRPAGRTQLLGGDARYLK